jgi:hypothetical protein
MRGHVIAFPNTSVGDLAKVLPIRVDQVQEVIQVIFLYIASEEEKKKKLAKASRSLHVRGKQIVLWAKHLCKVSLNLLCYIYPSCSYNQYANADSWLA